MVNLNMGHSTNHLETLSPVSEAFDVGLLTTVNINNGSGDIWTQTFWFNPPALEGLGRLHSH